MTSTLFFINDKATKIDELLLNSDWGFKERYPRVYDLTVKNKKVNWIVKMYKKKDRAKIESYNLSKLKGISGIPEVLAVRLSNDMNYIILSEAEGQDLFDYFNERDKLSEKETKNIIHNLLIIVEKMHKREVIHTDIKPENIVYDRKSGKVSLIDFEERHTEGYLSPSMVYGSGGSKSSDMWAIGVSCYLLLKGELPFKNKDEILHKDPKMSSSWSKDCKDFLRCLLDRNKRERYTVSEALRHPWLA